MDKEELGKYIGSGHLPLIEAMQKIDLNAKGIIYVTDDGGRLCGSLTDGDVRRWILRSGSLNCTVSEMMFRDTKYLSEAEAGLGRHAAFMQKEHIRSVPVVDAGMHIVDIYFKDDVPVQEGRAGSTALAGVPVIIMAGGRGVRLHPYTKILPKPLIPIGDVPILERILSQFYQSGAKEFFITVNYKKEMIKSYFAELKPPYKIHYVEEDEPLGTAGGIRLIGKRFDVPAIITNCDILVDADYPKVMRHHLESGNGMTIVSSLKDTNIPYGVLHTKEHGVVTSMEEKPRISYFINTGMYIVSPEYLEWIPKGQFFHMTDLADKMMEAGRQVGMYPVSGSAFLDMGEFGEMKKMEERLQGGGSLGT